MRTNPDIIESPVHDASHTGGSQEYLTADELMQRLEPHIRSLFSREEKRAQRRANSFAKLQEAFAGCELTDDEIRQECEAVRQEMQDHSYAN